MVAAVEDQSRTRLGAGAEHHAHQRVSGELQIQSNLSPTKLNFVGLAKNKSTGARRGGGGVGGRVSCKYLGYALNGH